MEPLSMLCWFAVGAIAASCLVAFWDEIREWLNNVAADFVERHLGYSARKYMQKAVAFVDRVVSIIRNRSVIYTRRPNSIMFDKTTIISEASVYDVEEDVLKEIKRNGTIVQEFSYGSK